MLLASVATGCSSDLSRFSYNQAVQDAQLTTASVLSPKSSGPIFSGLAPIGGAPNNSVSNVGVNQQKYPGDYRVPTQNNTQPTQIYQPGVYQPSVYQPAVNYNQPYPGNVTTASVPVTSQMVAPNPVRASATPINIPQAVTVSKLGPVTPQIIPVLPNAGIVPTPNTLARPIQTATSVVPTDKLPIIAPVIPGYRPQNIAQLPNVSPITTGSIQSSPVIVPMAPDPIVTGSLPKADAVAKGGWTTVGGTQLKLRDGETIYNLSRRYGVPANEILKANNIKNSNHVKSGQELIIPVYVYSRKAPVSAPDNDPKTFAAHSHTGTKLIFPDRNAPTPTPSPIRDVAILPSQNSAVRVKPVKAQPVTNVAKQNVVSSDKYVVVAGDSLSKIANKTKVSVAALKQANNLTNSNIRIGQKLIVPNKDFKVMTPDTTTTASVSASQQTIAPVENDSVASAANQSKSVTAPKNTGIETLRWPARGQISSSFGGKSDDGRRNDGIDMLMPEGTPVKASENGVVIYANNTLKGYGNTILVRHSDDLVTVYAHVKSYNVKRGDKVDRGQVLAYSGMSGSAKRPKLHFEVRKQATPVNPITYLE